MWSQDSTWFPNWVFALGGTSKGMVDFQSRDTRRGPTDNADEDEGSGAETDGDTQAETATPDEAVQERPESEEVLAYAVVRVTAEGGVSDDDAGDAVVETLEQAGQPISSRDLIQPGYDGLQNSAVNLTDRDDVGAVVFVGGTGVEPTDVTVDALGPLLDKELPGFGELLRESLADQVGAAVVGTRATAGIVDGIPVFLVPGHPDAARIALEELIVPEAPSLANAAAES